MSTSLLTKGVAGLIHEAGIGVYDPARRWLDSDTEFAVMMNKVPTSPPLVIALTPYHVQDSLRTTDSILGLQVRIRGNKNPATVLDADDAIFNLIHGMHDTVINGVPVALIWRDSWVPAQPDKNERWELASNYYIRTDVPTTYRDDD
ncbi:hypothetical protein SAMN05444157_1624 [Frankineae bacterium MT45]|nr:hypothetical protein SAMN05444157_1624 [Frankineae bacterium MT45]